MTETGATAGLAATASGSAGALGCSFALMLGDSGSTAPIGDRGGCSPSVLCEGLGGVIADTAALSAMDIAGGDAVTASEALTASPGCASSIVLRDRQGFNGAMYVPAYRSALFPSLDLQVWACAGKRAAPCLKHVGVYT